MAFSLDDIDFKILSFIQADARLQNTELAKRWVWRPPPCWNG